MTPFKTSNVCIVLLFLFTTTKSFLGNVAAFAKVFVHRHSHHFCHLCTPSSLKSMAGFDKILSGQRPCAGENIGAVK